jgi:hypothetical protein
MMATRRLISVDDLLDQLSSRELQERLDALLAEASGGCNACLFADPFSDRLCTVPDISPEDFDLGVSGIDCSRFQSRVQL